jgi:exodeoxyribonuclease VII large subunit
MKKKLSLFELNNEIKQALQISMPRTFMLVAEISEMRENGGHAFLELIEKDENGKTVAKASANIWAYSYRMIKPYFETSTGRSLSSGIKILVEVSVEFNEIYGYSLNIKDIDPTYTLGDIEKKRMEIIAELQQNGIIDMNKELEICRVPQRIAVISSETAAGYGDFINQIKNNEFGYKFYLKLFPAIMQGEKAEDSIIEAFDLINAEISNFDAVVLVRGGGAKSELECFDNYWLAFNIAQFPLPVITGLGHERDFSVADMVANTSVKTPTAAAQFLIDILNDFDNYLYELENNLLNSVSILVDEKKDELSDLSYLLRDASNIILQREKTNLGFSEIHIKNAVSNFIYYKNEFVSNKSKEVNYLIKNIFSKQISNLEKTRFELKHALHSTYNNQYHFLDLSSQKIKLLSHENILSRGYSITQLNGKIVKSVLEVNEGDLLTTYLFDGKIDSLVK